MKPQPPETRFAPIADYAVVGDGRTVALLASDGRVDWWPFPALDSPPLCAAVLDPERGGYFALRPVEPFDVSRRYLDGTNVLESTYWTAEGSVVITQALNLGNSGRLPWTEFAHRVVGLSGEVQMQFDWRPGDRFGGASPWVRSHRGTPITLVGDQFVALVSDARDTTHEAGRAYGRFTCCPGSRNTVALVATDREPLFLPDPQAVDERLDRTVESWRRWSERLAPESPWADAVIRSALALKLLLADDTGAIAAAATTSLPERIGGTKNWDYRFAWVRDTSFTLDALINLNLHEEVQRALSWLIATIRRNGLSLQVFYTLEGNEPPEEHELEAPGYQDSRPVRSGNRAATQSQLGTYGDVFDTVYRYCAAGHVLDQATAQMLAELADQCCDRWRNRDAGIWELTQPQHYTISKMGCWVALDRAGRLADEGLIEDRHAARWRTEAQCIRSWINDHCWSDAKQCYTFYAGTEDLDAAVLLAARTGFDRGDRLTSSIRAIRRELGVGPFLYRYSGAEAEEGAFVACTFWMVEALALSGQGEEATELMLQAIDFTNDVGLLAEQIDVGSGTFLGNVPQGLSHLALINASFTLHRLSQPRGLIPDARPTHEQAL